MNQPTVQTTQFNRFVGRSFVHPLFDYMLIGGGLSLTLVPFVYAVYGSKAVVSWEMLPWFILLSNSAHFAASTIRLYTKPGTRQALPFLTMAVPILSIVVLTLCILFADETGRYLTTLYLMWSPFHYAAQAYGLAVMYSYRSGCMLSPLDKKLLWWISLFPFFFVVFQMGEVELIRGLMPSQFLATKISMTPAIAPIVTFLGILSLALPVLLYAKVWRMGNSGPMPTISLLLLMTNAIWWIAFRGYNAFVFATIFHGVQYLAIVIIFHVKDQCANPDNKRGPLYHTLWFYGACILLGYGLFNCWPRAYMLAGFGPAESVLLVVAVINIHHFIVDAYIWKLGPSDTNRRILQYK